MRLIPLFRPNTTIHRIMQINKSQPKDKYNQASWISYNTNYTDEKYAEFGHGCMISIALDAGSSNLFSGIRVLIVAEEVDSLHNTVRSHKALVLLHICITDAQTRSSRIASNLPKSITLPHPNNHQRTRKRFRTPEMTPVISS